VQREPGVDDVLDEEDVAIADVCVEVFEQPDPTNPAELAPVVPRELHEVDPVHEGRRAGEIGQEDEAPLERADEERLAARVVLGDSTAELSDAHPDLLGGQVDLTDAVVGATLALGGG
jgi:hypothetical protein